MHHLHRLVLGTSNRILGGAAALLCVTALAGAGCSKDDDKGTATAAAHTTTTSAGGSGQGGGSDGGNGQGTGGGQTGSGGQATGTGGGQTTGGGGGQGNGGAGGQGTGAAGGQGQGGQGPTYLCTVNTHWTLIPGAMPVIATDQDDLLGSITADELSIAFLATAAGEVRYADRTDSVNAFDVIRTAPAAAGWYGMERVALSPDGLRLVVVSSDKKKLGQLTRKTREDAFAGTPDTTAFAALNGALQADESIGDPIVSNDDGLLVYSVYSATATTTIHLAAHGSPGAAWQATADTFGGAELDAKNGKRRQPTGLSGDLLTLYYWDESASLQRAAWREHIGDPFTYFEDYPQLTRAVPTGNCKRMYFTGAGAASKDIQFALPE